MRRKKAKLSEAQIVFPNPPVAFCYAPSASGDVGEKNDLSSLMNISTWQTSNKCPNCGNAERSWNNSGAFNL